MRALIVYIAIVLLLSVGVVIALYALSYDIRTIPGSFLRQYPPHPVVERHQRTLSDDTYYLAGATDHSVYVGSRSRPLRVLKLSANLADTTVITIRLAETTQLPFYKIKIVIDSPRFYVMDGSIPYYYRGTMKDWRAERVLHEPIYFQDAAPLPSGNFALTAVSARTGESVLGRYSLTESNANLRYDLLEKQDAGIFTTDGDLQYNTALNQFIYVYYYRNEYLVLDTTLNLTYRAHTIDTFRTARVKYDTLHRRGSVSLSAPPLIVNKQFTMSNDLLLIHSMLPARNEDLDAFKHGFVVDVYRLPQQEYVLSFYLYPTAQERKLSFLATRRKLYTLFGTRVSVHDLVHEAFKRAATRYDTKPVSQE